MNAVVWVRSCTITHTSNMIIGYVSACMHSVTCFRKLLCVGLRGVCLQVRQSILLLNSICTETESRRVTASIGQSQGTSQGISPNWALLLQFTTLQCPGALAVISEGVDVVFHLAAVVSGAAEADFDLGMKVNFDATRSVLTRCRRLEVRSEHIRPSINGVCQFLH